eukprot:513654-Pleurochrysis_carterae.AAC.1
MGMIVLKVPAIGLSKSSEWRRKLTLRKKCYYPSWHATPPCVRNRISSASVVHFHAMLGRKHAANKGNYNLYFLDLLEHKEIAMMVDVLGARVVLRVVSGL